jgi:multicomponent Na+:H+ antiporter subunit A
VALVLFVITIFWAWLWTTHGTVVGSWPWFESLGVSLAFRFDSLSALFCMLITGVGSAVFGFAPAYFRDASKLAKFQWTTLSFLIAMLGVVLADDVFLLFVFWELTGVTSWLLIAFKSGEEKARKAALTALLVTGGGGLALFAGLLGLQDFFQTSQISVMAAQVMHAGVTEVPTWILICVFAGAFTKSAQWPLHFWLPGAMAAPTPISAFLHSATMVKAGIWLLARFTPVLSGHPLWTPVLVTVGSVTFLWGLALALTRDDLKDALAQTTVSALGLMTLLLGMGTPAAAQALVVTILAHGLYKSAMFLACGALETNLGTRQISKLDAVASRSPWSSAALALGALSAAGIPPFLGFVAKETLLGAAFTGGHRHGNVDGAIFVTIVGSIGAALTVAFCIHAVPIRELLRRRLPASAGSAGSFVVDPVNAWLWPVVLGSLGLVSGILTAPLGTWLLDDAAWAILPHADAAQPASLALWHGLTPALVLSVFCITAGALLWRPLKALVTRQLSWTWGGASIFQQGLDLSLEQGARLTRWIQSDVIRAQMARTFASAAFLIGVALAWFWIFPELTTHFSGSLTAAAPASVTTRHGGVGLIDGAGLAFMLLGSLATVFARTRLEGIVTLGAVGFGMSLIFATFGAPDLALTQFSVEAVSVLLMVAAIAGLPQIRRHSRSLWERSSSLLLASSFGILMASITILAMASQAPSRLSEWFMTNSLPLANGRNVVNVILVDFRALDTMGEATVLAIAALGLSALFKGGPP